IAEPRRRPRGRRDERPGHRRRGRVQADLDAHEAARVRGPADGRACPRARRTERCLHRSGGRRRRRGDARARPRRRALREVRQRQCRRPLRRRRALSPPASPDRPAALMHLFLVGPPGIGKSSVAPLLARHFGAAVVDLDREIERRARKSCKDVIEQEGMDRLRDLEASVLAKLRPTPSWGVVDTGGGAPITQVNRAIMPDLGLIVGLRGLVDRVAAGLVAGRGVRIDVAGPDHGCRVLIRAGLLEHVGPHLADLGWHGRVAVVSDPVTAAHYESDLVRSLAAAGLNATTLRIPAGERGKRLHIAARLWASLARERIGRDGGILALGGGSVGDVAGFVAATYLRGIRIAQIPTTLLGMADASIGGKTAVDIAAGKNLVGAFHFPDAVFADVSVLTSLPPRQLSSGLAEVVKSAFLLDRESVAQLGRGLERMLAGDLAALLAAVAIGAQ